MFANEGHLRRHLAPRPVKLLIREGECQQLGNRLSAGTAVERQKKPAHYSVSSGVQVQES